MSTCKIKDMNAYDEARLSKIAARIYWQMAPWDRDADEVMSPEAITDEIVKDPLATIEYLLDMME